MRFPLQSEDATPRTLPENWQGAGWIGTPVAVHNVTDPYGNHPTPILYKSFKLAAKPITAAKLQIIGLGYYIATLNAVRASYPLAPLWTPYRQRLLYDSYDVKSLVRPGQNRLQVELGNGWYNPLPLKMWGRLDLRANLAVGEPCLLLLLEITFADGERYNVVSDTTWHCYHGGPRLRNNIYLGEVYDARCPDLPSANNDFDALPAIRRPPPGENLQPRQAPLIEAGVGWCATQITTPAAGYHVADMGRNFTGQALFRLGRGCAGEEISFTYGELLDDNGYVNSLTAVCGQIKSAGKGGPGAPDVAVPRDTYIRSGNGEESFQPQFAWRGFRYVAIEGLAHTPACDDIEAVPLASKLAANGRLDFSLPELNRLHQLCHQTFISNLVGVQSDCPSRERFGYGGDIAVTSEALIFNYDMESFYSKTIDDFADEAAVDGWFTQTAPYNGSASCGFGGRAGAIGWTVALPILIHDLYRYYGTRAPMEQHYTACCNYLEQIVKLFPDLIVPNCIGDHEALEKAPPAVTATAHFFQWTALLAHFGQILGDSHRAMRYRHLADAIRDAFQANFVKNGVVAGGGQGPQLFGLYHNLIAEGERKAALEELQRDVAAHDGALTTGIFSTKYLCNLQEGSEFDSMVADMLMRREYPGWLHMLDRGATTLWETWCESHNIYSHNHPMFGSLVEWLAKRVWGVMVSPSAVGANRILVKPTPPAGVASTRGSYTTPHGRVELAWWLERQRLHLELLVPEGVQARVWLRHEQRWVDVQSGHHHW